MRALPGLLSCLLLAYCVEGAAGSEVFRFWPEEGAKSAPGFKRMSEHPCGEVAVAEVSKLPTAKAGPLVSEIVVELNRVGKVIRRWPMPVDFTPVAVRRDELLVVAGDQGFWVRSNGSFRKASAIPALDEEQTRMQCDLTSVFGKSVYAGCSVFIDLASRKKRTLGYEGVCT